MKNILGYLIIIFLWIGNITLSHAQNVGINTSGAAPDNSAILDITSTDKGLLIPRMDSTSRKNIVAPAVGLMVFDSTFNSFYFYNGSGWSAVAGDGGADNLGDHIASQNIQLNNHWLNNDGGTDEGIHIDATGQVGLGKIPEAILDIDMKSRIVTHISQTVHDGFTEGFSDGSNNTICQSFTPIQDGTLYSIEFLVNGDRSCTYKLYEGVGNGGPALTSSITQSDPTAPYLFSGITLTANQVYTIEIVTAINTYAYSFADVYAGGQVCTDANLDYYFKVNYEVINSGGFKVTNETIQINEYSLPIDDGVNGQILSTNGSGTLAWTNPEVNTDAQDLSLSGNILNLSNDATSVDLSAYLDNTDAQDLSLLGNTLSLENDATSVDLSGFANTDAQDLSLSGNTLSLSNDATSVDLSGYVNTDAQDLSLSSNTLSLSNDVTSVDLSDFIQDLSLSGNTLSLSDDATNVDLSGYLDNTDAQDLDLSGNTLSLTNDGTTVDLSSFAGGSDNLGNHSASQALQLNDNWLNNDGGASEGIRISNNGNVGIGTDPSATFHVDMGQSGSAESTFYDVTNNGTTNNLLFIWQSFIPTETGFLTSVSLPITGASGAGTYRLYEGEGNTGTVLSESAITFTAGEVLCSFDNILLTANQQYTFFFTSVATSAVYSFNTTNPYSGGISSFSNSYDLDCTMKILPEVPGFRVNNNGVTINKYTLPSNDGVANQVLSTDGNGNVSWTSSSGGGDNLGNHIASQNIELNGNWLSNTSGDQGLQIDNSGNVSIATTLNVNSSEVEGILNLGSGQGDDLGSPSEGITFHNTNAGGFGHAAIYPEGKLGFNGDLIFATDGDDTQNYNPTEKMRISHDGKVGIGRDASTYLLEVEGNASKNTAGNWLANSDSRLKKNIVPLSSQEMLTKVLSLKGVTYEWNDIQTGTTRPEGVQYGFSAQNIQEVFPTLVTLDNTGYLQTAYGTYDAMTVEAIRALNEKIIKIEKENATLRSQNQELQSKMNELDGLKAAFSELRSMVDKATISSSRSNGFSEE